MKIVHIIYSFNTGGAETMLVDIVNEQIKLTSVSIVVINKVYNQSLLSKIDKRVNIYFINRKPNSKNPYSIIKLNSLLFRLKANVFHCHNHNIIPLLANNFRSKSVLTLHCMGIPSKYLNNYNRLIAISKSVKNDILERTGINTQIVYNGISTELIRPKEVKSIDSKFKIVIVGRLDHTVKGQHLVIEALNFLKLMGIDNIRLDIIGEGNSKEYLKNITLKYELTEQVNFLGLKDRIYIYEHLKDYDLLIQPSLYEGFGLTIAEGMAANLPVLVSDVDGPIEIIEQGKYGKFFKSNNSLDCANNILEIIKNGYKIDTAIARKYTLENYSIESTVNEYYKYYK